MQVMSMTSAKIFRKITTPISEVYSTVSGRNVYFNVPSLWTVSPHSIMNDSIAA